MLRIFSTVFLSSFVAALPFLLVAVLTSGLIEVFLSRDAVRRLLPKNPVLAVLTAPLIGFFLPLCECGVIPVAGRLAKKGVPLSVAITFMLANPILNPFPLLSTRLAFSFFPAMLIWRMVGAYVIAVTVGLLIMVVAKIDRSSAWGRTYRGGGLWQLVDEQAAAGWGQLSLGQRLTGALAHASMEFFFVGRFFIVGSFLAACVQVFVPSDLLIQFAAGNAVPVGGMMIFAFLISVCSEVDAFVASGFLGVFPPGALLAFLLLGPMVDIKNTLMMLTTFPRPLVVRLIMIIVVLVFVAGIVANTWMG